MRPIRIFFYVDSGAMISHCVTAAELLRKQLGAQIIMMLVDSGKYVNETMENYEIYDYESLFGAPGKPPWSLSAKIKRLFGFGLQRSVWRHRGNMSEANARSAFAASKHISHRYARLKLVRLILVPPLRLLRTFAGDLRSTRVGRSGRHLSRLLLSVHRVNRFLGEIQPDVIVLPEDNIETLSTIIVARGGARNIPSIIVPFTIPNPLEPARHYLNNALYQAKGIFAQILTAYYPKWHIKHEGKDLLRLPAVKALGLEMLGLSSPAPWILNRGGAASIALESDVQRDLYLKLGFPSAQLRVIGDMNGEVFNRSLSNKQRLAEELCARHGLRPGRPLILCGFPPDQYVGAETSRYEFPSYDALIQAWMGSFKALGERANVLVRPHPRIPLDRFANFGNSCIKLTWQPTVELIPLCDLYVASISATIRWAIACGIPTVNYDTFRYRYGDYESVAGVIGVEEVSEFRALITRFVDDPVFAAELAEKQQSVMRYWGQSDDQVGQRFASLVLEAVKNAGRYGRDAYFRASLAAG
jgi:hypothetical protein